MPPLEAALLPHLFPQGFGHYDGHQTLSAYVKGRMQMLLSPFTLYAPYPLLMFMQRQHALLLQSIKHKSLERWLHRRAGAGGLPRWSSRRPCCALLRRAPNAVTPAHGCA